MIPLFLPQKTTEQSIDKKSLFFQSLMTEHVTVQHDSNDLVVKLTNIEEQTRNSLASIDFIVF